MIREASPSISPEGSPNGILTSGSVTQPAQMNAHGTSSRQRTETTPSLFSSWSTRSSRNALPSLRLLHQHLHAEIVIHPLSPPAGDFGSDGQAAPVAERLCMARQNTVDGFAVRFDESQRAVVEDDDANAAFMHGVMMESAQRYEVRRLGFPAAGPVLDVMRVDVACVRATWEATTLVSCIQQAAQR